MIHQFHCNGVPCTLEIDDAGMSAALQLPADGKAPELGSLMEALRANKLRDLDETAIKRLLARQDQRQEPVVVAKGKPPVHRRPPRLDMRTMPCDLNTGTPSKVDPGQLLAVIAPPVPGTTGTNMFGEPVAFDAPEPEYKLGRNIRSESNQVFATARGNLRLTNGELSVEPLMELHGDDDGGSALISHDGDMLIRGSLRDGRTVSATGVLIVGGAVEAAQVKTGNMLLIKGGFIGKNRGRCVVDGDARCRFISGGSLISAGDVIVQSEVAYSNVTCAGKLTVSHGPIVGGEIAANAGIACQSLGSANGKLTVVEAGTEQSFINFIAAAKAEIEANRARVADVRQKIEPLLKHVKGLTPQQKEKATELLYEAGELEARTEQMTADLTTRYTAFRRRTQPAIEVADVAYAGVVIRFPGIEARLHHPIRGPVILKPVKTGNVTDIVIIDATTGSRCVLETNRQAAA